MTMAILGIDTGKLYTLAEAKEVLEGAPIPRYEDRYHGIYFYEMWPLIWVMEYLNPAKSDYGQLRFSDGERTDDGIVILNGINQEIQFTEATDGYQEAIRMEHLAEYGRAPGIQDMKWEGTRRNRILPQQETDAIERGEILEKSKSLILDAVKRKIQPQYNGMWLGVVFEDHTPSNSERTIQEYKPVCDSVMQEYAVQLKKIYTKVFFIGKSGNHITHYDL